MSETFDALKAEIIRSISSLRDKQSFQIIFLGEKPQTLFEDGLSAAKRDNKIKAVEFIKDIKLDGKDAKAAAAMTTAFESLKNVEGEKMIHLLSAGSLADADAVAELIKKENSGQKKVIINTFQYSAKSDDAAEKSLKTLADETGGKYKFVEAE